MCTCPEVVPCDICNSRECVVEFQGCHICEKCLKWRPSNEA